MRTSWPEPSALAAIALLAGACSRDDARPYFGATSRVGKADDTIYINSGGEPEYIDPGKCTDTLGEALIDQLFEGLTGVDPRDGHAVQGVAERWDQSDDNRLFRFHLRPDAKWSNGAQVTARDFEYAWKRALRPATGSRSASNLYVLKNGERFNQGAIADESLVGVHAIDDLTLDVELEGPTPYFTSLTSYPTLFPVPREVVEPFDRRGDPDMWVRPENIVSNGPYTLEDWKFRYEISMRQNPHYWRRDKLKTRRVVWLVVDQSHAAMDLYKAGELDCLGDEIAPPGEYLPMLDRKKDFFTSRHLSVQWYDLNTKRPPLDDARVRRALNLAIDKASLVERVLRGGQLPATHYVPDFTGSGYAAAAAADEAAGTSPFSGREREYNPARARELLKEAGYTIVPDGEGYRAVGFPQIEIIYAPNEDLREGAVATQEMWRRQLGIPVSLRSEDWKVLLSEYREGRYQVMRLGWAADYDHPHTFLDLLRTGNAQNATGWSDRHYDDLIQRAMAEPDPARSIALYRQAEAIAVEAMPRIPLYVNSRRTLVKPWIKGYWGSPLRPHHIEYLWVDPRWDQGAPNEPAFLPLEFPPPGRLSP